MFKAVFLSLSLLLVSQQADEPYPGQKDHKEPPKDWVCKRPEMDRVGVAPLEEQAHWCSCERMWDDSLQWMHNDMDCTVRCHEDHCTCPVVGATKRMPGYRGGDLEESTPNPFSLAPQ